MFHQISTVFFFTFLLYASSHRIKETNSIEHHINNPEHDPSIDHEAFLGIDESKTFDKLLPEESKLRLKNLITSKVDIDGSGTVTVDELKKWISHIAKLSKEKERDDYFPMFLNSSDALLDYDTYFAHVYGGLDEEQLDEVSKANLAIMQMQDSRKWETVDENKDSKLDKNEFLVFQHPEDYGKMKSLIIQETLEISDKNKDGYLDLNEYISDFWPASDKTRPEEHLVKQEEETFRMHRDRNHDGKLDTDEIGEWLMPTNYDAVEAETRHLFHNADLNEDGQLSLEEISESYDVFVGSQATDYGNSLKHDEL